MLRVSHIILVVCCIVYRVEGQGTAPAQDNSLVLPIAVGFLLKVVLVVLGGMIKLLFLGLTSLGISGVALLLGILFLKSNGLVVPPGHPPAGWHDREWLPYKVKRYGLGNGYYYSARQLQAAPDFYKPNIGKHNGEHPVPVAEVDPRRMDGERKVPHHLQNRNQEQEEWTPIMKDSADSETEKATFKKQAMEHTQTYTLAN